MTTYLQLIAPFRYKDTFLFKYMFPLKVIIIVFQLKDVGKGHGELIVLQIVQMDVLTVIAFLKMAPVFGVVMHKDVFTELVIQKQLFVQRGVEPD